MIRKSGNRFSEKIMLKQRDEIVMRFRLIASWSRASVLIQSEPKRLQRFSSAAFEEKPDDRFWLATGSWHTTAIPRRELRPGCFHQRPPRSKGRGECRVPAAPAASRANKKAHERSRHGCCRITRHSRTQWF